MQFLSLVLAVLTVYAVTAQRLSSGLLSYVNILGGTKSFYDVSTGSTLPLLTRPWGATSFAPQTHDPSDTGDGHGKMWWFQPEARRLFGIRCTHQPSPWISDYGHFIMNAFIPGASASHRTDSTFNSGYNPKKSTFSPHLFETELLAYRSQHGAASMAFTAGRHSGMMRARFPEPDRLDHEYYDATRRVSVGINGGSDSATAYMRDEALGLNTAVISGYSTANSGGLANPSTFKHFFVMAMYTGPNGDQPLAARAASKGESSEWAWLDFPETVGEITVRVGVSFISEAQALLNLHQELDGLSFDTAVQQAEQVWEQQLSKTVVADVGSAYDEQEQKLMKQVYYTAAYRAAIFPRQLSEIDADGREVHYSPYDADGGVHPGPLSADSGFWDAYSTLYPFHSLVNLDILGPQMLTGWLNAYKESGWLPKWASPGHRDSMTGSMADATFSDAIIKNIPGFDAELAYEAVRKDCFEVPKQGNVGRPCLDAYIEHGFIPVGAKSSTGDNCDQVVSRALLYMQADHAVAQAAAFLGKTDDATVLNARAANYSSLFDQATGFFRPRTVLPSGETTFQKNFDEFSWGGEYTEAGPWQYRFFVPWDPKGLAALYDAGGRSLGEELTRAQEMPSVFHVGNYGSEIHEQTELALHNWGQYAHSNQPSHYMLWMFGAIGDEDAALKGQYYLRRAVTELYSPGLEFVSGDEDNGQMSAWYLLSSAGLYSLSPGSTSAYRLGSPLFARLTLQLGGGISLTVVAENNGPKNVFVSSVRLNGAVLEVGGTVEYKQLMEGGELVFTMTAGPLAK